MQQCIAQNLKIEQQIDSINKIIIDPKSHDTLLAKSYIFLSEILSETKPDSVPLLCNKAKSIVNISLKKHSSKAIKISLTESYAAAENNIAIYYRNKGEITLALETLHKSLKLYEQTKNQEGIANCLINIGSIYAQQKNHEKAIDYFSKSLKKYELTNNKIGAAACLNNIGGIYNSMSKQADALKFYYKSLDILTELNFKEGISANLNNIGTIYKAQKNYTKALEYYTKSLSILEELGNQRGLAYSLNNIAGVMFAQQNLTQAIEYAKKSLMISKKIGYPENIRNAAKVLSIVYEKKGDTDNALKMYKLYINMRDSIDNDQITKASAEQEAKYEYEKQKTIDDAAHDKQIALEQEEQKKQRIISISIAIGLVLVVIFLIFVFNRLRVTRKQKIVIEQQRDIVEEAHKEITDSINYAERIQRSFLATEELLSQNLNEYFVFFQPKNVVSGDFYWADKLTNNQFAIVNADSTGHGVPGAIMSILNISSIERALDKGLLNPAEIFNDTRKTIIERLAKDGSVEGGKDGMDASMISFDFINNKFSYAAAQNPIWIIRNKELIEIKPEKMPIGKHDNDTIPFVGGEFETQRGDVIYTLTDGFQDQFGGENGKKFKVKPFKDFLITISHLPMQEQHKKLQETFINWKGNLEQVDDICIIGVRI